MSLPSSVYTTTCDIYRPFGAGSPTATAVPCKLVGDLSRGRGSGLSSVLSWTHYIDVDDGLDIRDGCIRSPGSDAVTYYEGDEIRIPTGATTKYVVVWVETRNFGTSRAYKRVYLLRDTA
jgi:hypothetical protein